MRVWASLAGGRAAADESIVLLATNNLVGWKLFSELRRKVDVILNDENSTSLEPESPIPMTATRNRARFGRLHYIGVCDFKQLSLLSKTLHQMRGLKWSVGFNYETQRISQFERLFRAKRVPVALLLTQC